MARAKRFMLYVLVVCPLDPGIECLLCIPMQYPEGLREYEYIPNFAVRGLHYDVQKVSISLEPYVLEAQESLDS